jgi:hypothetical protein
LAIGVIAHGGGVHVVVADIVEQIACEPTYRMLVPGEVLVEQDAREIVERFVVRRAECLVEPPAGAGDGGLAGDALGVAEAMENLQAEGVDGADEGAGQPLLLFLSRAAIRIMVVPPVGRRWAHLER